MTSYNDLIKHLKSYGNAAVAFSGGVDSTFLLKALKDALGQNVLAITVNTPYIPDWELDEAREYTKANGIRHIMIDVPILDKISNNPENRCYICKKHIFGIIKEKAALEGFMNVMDGTNFDDLDDYRPGLKALKELGILSPLKDMGIGKMKIREYSREFDLPTWNKPAYACLLTRIPHNTPVKMDVLARIEAGEKILFDLGIKEVRVRVHDDIARIEVNRDKRLLFFDMSLMDIITDKFKSIGFKYVTLDLSGYKMGSFNKKEESDEHK